MELLTIDIMYMCIGDGGYVPYGGNNTAMGMRIVLPYTTLESVLNDRNSMLLSLRYLLIQLTDIMEK